MVIPITAVAVAIFVGIILCVMNCQKSPYNPSTFDFENESVVTIVSEKNSRDEDDTLGSYQFSLGDGDEDDEYA